MDALKDWWDRKKREPVAYPCVVFGHVVENDESLRVILEKVTLFTYRENFTAFPRSSCTSDKGWGCLVRTSQMMLARALVLHEEFHLSHFYDRDDPAHPFSIHNFVRAVSDGTSQFKATYWSPSQGSRAIQQVVNNATSSGAIARPLGVHLSHGCTLYNDQVMFAMRERGSLIILVPVRCGIARRLSQTAYMTVERLMSHPTSLGVVGGVPNRSYFIIGTTGQRVLYLDPHVSVQPAMVNEETRGMTFGTPQTVPVVAWDRLDTSLLFGFYCRNLADYNSLSSKILELNVSNEGDNLIYIEETDTCKGCDANGSPQEAADCAGWSSHDEDDG